MRKSKKNYLIYTFMLFLFGLLIYVVLRQGMRFAEVGEAAVVQQQGRAFELFQRIIADNLASPLALLLFQIIVILAAVRIFSWLFSYIGQPGVMGEIIAGIVLGPSLLGYFFPNFFELLFPPASLMNLDLLSQIGLVLFMFVIGMELDFGILKNKMNETLMISHAGIVVPFFLGLVISFGVYEKYAVAHTAFLPFALFIGISMSITAFPVLARIVQERGLTKKHIGILSIASAANDDVTAWCLLAVVIAIAKAGTFVSALFTIALTLLYILVMFLLVRPFLKKIGNVYANSEVINKTFVAFIFLVLVLSAVTTEIIGIHALFGAFMAGVVMPSNLGFRRVMMEKVEDIALVFFLPLFFAFTGLRTEIGLLNSPELWGVCALFVGVAIAGKLGGCAIASRLVGESWKDSFIIGTLMNTRGLMELIALNIGYEMGVLPPSIFVILVLMALITTFMTTPLLAFFEKVFHVKEGIVAWKDKILLSFGKPESGRILLSVIHFFLGDQLKNTELIAAHFTLGTDVNPAKAEEYAYKSFQPIRGEAEQLGIKLTERYQVTDKLIYEVARMAEKEQVRFLFVGAGQQFMQEYTQRLVEPSLPLLYRLFRTISQSTYNLPGILHREKIEKMMREVDCPVAIFVNRHFYRPETVYWILGGEEDLFLTEYMVALLAKGVNIHFSYREENAGNRALQNCLDNLSSQYPENLIPGLSLRNQKALQGVNHLVVLSYTTCVHLAADPILFSSLPSLLVIHPGKINQGKEVAE